METMEVYCVVKTPSISVNVKLFDMIKKVTIVSSLEKYFKNKTNMGKLGFWYTIDIDLTNSLRFHLKNYVEEKKVLEPILFLEYLEKHNIFHSKWVPKTTGDWVSFASDTFKETKDFPCYTILRLLNIVPYFDTPENLPNLCLQNVGFWRNLADNIGFRYFQLTPKLPSQNNFKFRDLFFGVLHSDPYPDFGAFTPDEGMFFDFTPPVYTYSCGCSVTGINRDCSLLIKLTSIMFLLAKNKKFSCLEQVPCDSPCKCTTIKTIEFLPELNLFFFLDTFLEDEKFTLVEIKYQCNANFAATIHTVNTGIDSKDISYFVSHFDLIFQILEGISLEDCKQIVINQNFSSIKKWPSIDVFQNEGSVSSFSWLSLSNASTDKDLINLDPLIELLLRFSELNSPKYSTKLKNYVSLFSNLDYRFVFLQNACYENFELNVFFSMLQVENSQMCQKSKRNKKRQKRREKSLTQKGIESTPVSS